MASEIKRLIDVNTVVDIEPNYTFHREDCTHQDNTPFENPKEFHRRGKSSSGSQKYMCKYCGKMTNILPEQEESFNYNQKRNDVLVGMVKEIIGRSPVKKTMDRTYIGASTYYNKVEIIYKRCLAFLERHETKPLKKKQFNTLWLQTDKFSYYLNNIRKKGCSSAKGVRENALFNTFIVATVDSYSNYIFRSDLAYDYMLNYEDLLGDIIVYREDQIYKYAQKNAKYRYLYYGSRYDKEDNSDKINVNNIHDRKNYVDGFHVNSYYTAYAQYWLINNMLNAKHINYVTDNDTSLTGAIIRANIEGVKENKVDVFTCSIDKTLDPAEAKTLSRDYRGALEDYKKIHCENGTTKEAAIMKILEELGNDGIYKNVTDDRGNPYVGKNKDRVKLEHPLPYMDEGRRFIDCCTDLSHLSNEELAAKLYKVNMRSINTYFSMIRRSINILERPVVTSRGKKSYIYSNYNPKYAHQLTTILRTYLNFCKPIKRDGIYQTPAMTLGIAKKPYDVKDIIYFW